MEKSYKCLSEVMLVGKRHVRYNKVVCILKGSPVRMSLMDDWLKGRRQIFCNSLKLPTYNINTETHTGLALILNNVDFDNMYARIGSDVDHENLRRRTTRH